ncbi:flagellar hook-length control protein FliK [Bovifimicola ammoniilytica]|uniref:flagellar hook-length control protein FliK n=1 Tax=Bovifimicola ammoniilytica TaxID=2981720 RepID=UPI000821C1FB|nr:flagellar hook-length control protein FliK [Bovifimicola ammoniilytica]MCU6753206.1 flagellar hook-length control protein FliK [Bovifimicola ammoniilytica]SCJ56993.1 Flagellar hook-length control protein FliK [uncultured Eubacterium sp.]
MVSTNISGKFKVDILKSSNDTKSVNKTSDGDFTKILSRHTTSDSKETFKTYNSEKNSDVKNVIKKFYSDKPQIRGNEQKIDDTDIEKAVAEAYSQIINVIADALNANPDEIKGIINELDINLNALSDNQNVIKIVSKYLGINNPVNVLTNDEAINAVKEINQSISEIINELKDEFAITDDGLKDLLSKIDTVRDTENIEDIINDETGNVDASDDIIKVSDENNNKINIDSENDNIVPEKTTVKNEENANAGNNKEFNTDRESKSELYLNENGMESIVSNLKNTITDNILTEDGIADKIIKQITDDIRLYAKADTTALEIQLEPETLGKVGITVTSKAGTITAQLVVQNEVAKEAIESQMATLKESFASQDIKVDAVEVTIASKEFEQNLDKGAGNSSEQNENKRRKHISTEELAEINGTATDKETSIDNVLKEMGTTVNYSV